VLVRKRFAAVLGTLVMAFGIVIATASPASAYEIEYAVDVDWNTDHRKECTRDTAVMPGEACVQPVGDDIWVRDLATNGMAVAVYWDDLDSARAGKCVDNLGAAKAWTMCNKDWTDGHTIRWRFAWEYNPGEWYVTDDYWDTKI
jgi:hypothetical protein